MSCTIDVLTNVDDELVDVEEVEAFLERLCAYLGLDEQEFSVTFCGDEEIAELNEVYRGKEGPTDILSFPQSENIDDEFPVEESLLGDMIISVDTLKRNAKYFNVSEYVELHRLLIHGMLHLCGMDHGTNDPGEPMLLRQEQILEELLEIRFE